MSIYTLHDLAYAYGVPEPVREMLFALQDRITELEAQRRPLTDEQVKELLRIGPVNAPDGVITRTPFAYRKELLDTAMWALRKAEAAHGIKEGT